MAIDRRDKTLSYKISFWCYILIPIIILLCLIFSCERQEEFCWNCTFIETDISEGTVHYEPFVWCDKTEEWIRGEEASYTRIICDYSSILKCKKQ